MMIIANPIYDIVFKYLMEDERIARTILSALLKKEVVAVEVRPHEYSDDHRDTLSVFRIDFGATIREADGHERLILVELQKTWIETETLRFRQYLGVQYSSPRNMVGDNALPMVAVYLLGHKVGDIEEPVFYVHHHAYDYNGNLVTKGLPNHFVDSLTHDSIIVQIPRLHGQINNRLDRVLSIFDQTRKDEYDEHMLRIDDRMYSDDREMERILHRLTMAAADADMRHRMNVEDEYFSVIEKRDTEILLKNRELAEKRALLKEQSAQLEEQNAQLEEQSAQLEEQSAQLEEQSAQLEEQSAQLEEQSAQLEEQSAQLEEQSAQLEEQSAQLEEQNAQLEEQSAQLEEQSAQLEEQSAQLEAKNTQLQENQKMLQASIQMLLKAGLSPEDIAKSLDKDIELVRKFMSSSQSM